MGYAQRFVIGLVITISAYSLLTSAQDRYTFHRVFNQLCKTLNRQISCYECVQTYRSIAVVVIFAAGASLILDFGVTIGVIAQLLVIALKGVQVSFGSELGDVKWLLINLVLLVVLVNNYESFRQESKVVASVEKENQGAQREMIKEKKVQEEVASANKGKAAKGQKPQKK